MHFTVKVQIMKQTFKPGMTKKSYVFSNCDNFAALSLKFNSTLCFPGILTFLT